MSSLIFPTHDPKPLASVNENIKQVKNLDDLVKQQQMPIAAPGGFVPRRKVDLSADVTTAKEQMQFSLKQVQPLLDEIAEKVYGKNGEKFDGYTAKDQAGVKVLAEDQIIKQADVFNRLYGGGTYSQSLIENALRAKGNEYLLHNDIEFEALKLKSEAEKKGIVIPEKTVTDNIAALQTKMTAKLLADHSVIESQLQKVTDNLKTERDEVLSSVQGRYDYEYFKIKNKLISDEQDRVLNEIFQHTSEVNDSNLPDEAKKQEIENFEARANADLQKYTSRYYRHFAQAEFDEKFGESYARDINEVSIPYQKSLQNEISKANQRYKRIADESNVNFREHAQQYIDDINTLNNQSLREIYNTAVQNTLENRQKKEIGYRNTLQALSKTPYIGNGILTKFFGNAFLNSLGHYSKNIGNFLDANGMGGFVTDLMKGQGDILERNNFVYKPDLSIENFFSPTWLAQSFGNTAGYMAPSIVLSAITKNPFIAGTISAMGDAAMNAGELYPQLLSQGLDPAEASQRVRDNFIKDFVVSAPLEMVVSKMFTSGFAGKAASARELIGGAAGEYAQETTQNAISATALDPRKKFWDEWRSKQNQMAGLEAGMGAFVFGGASHFTSLIHQANPPALQAQWVADQVMRGGPARAKMLAELQLHTGDITGEQFDDITNRIDGVTQKVQDAQALGLSKAETLLYIGHSTQAEDAKAQSVAIQDPILKKAKEQEAEDYQKDAVAVIKGDIQAGLIDVAGIGNIAAEQKKADKVNEGMAKLKAPEVINEKPELSDEELDLVNALYEHQDSINGVFGQAIKDRIDDPTEYRTLVDTVSSQIQDDANTGRKIFGDEIVNMVLKNKENESTQTTAGINEQQSTEGTIAATSTEGEKENSESQTQVQEGQTGTINDQPDTGEQADQVGENTEPISQNKVNEKETNTTETPQEPQSEGAAVESASPVEGQRSAFLDKIAGNDQTSDFSIYNKLPKNKKKIKLDAIAKKVLQAKENNIITQEDFDNLSEHINSNYKELGETGANPLSGIKEVVPKDIIPDGDDFTGEGDQRKAKNKESAKRIAEKIRAKKAAGNKAYDALLGIPVAIYNGMLETVATLIEAGGTVADAVKAATDYIKQHTQGEKFTDKEIKDAVVRNLQEVGLVEQKVNKSAAKKSVEAQHEKSATTGTVSFRTLFKKRIRAEKNAAQAIKGLMEDARQHFKENGIDLAQKRIVRLMKALQQLTKLDNPGEALLDAIDRIDMIVAEQKVANTVTKSRALIKKIKAMIRKSGIMTQTNANFLKGLEFASPSKVLRLGESELATYTKTLQSILDAFGNKQGERTVSKEDIQAYFNELVQKLNDLDQQRLEQRVADLIEAGELPEGTTVDDYLASKEAGKTSKETKDDAPYREIVRLLQEDLKEADVSEKGKQEAKELSDIDVSELDSKQLHKLNDLLNNILLDDDFTDVGKFLAYNKDFKTRMAVIEAKESGLTVRKLNPTAVSMKVLNNLFNSLLYNSKQADKFVSIFYQPFRSKINEAQRVMEGTKKEPGIVHRANEIILKHKMTEQSMYNIGVAAFLNQLEDIGLGVQKLLTQINKMYYESFTEGDNIRSATFKKTTIATAEALRGLGIIKSYKVDDANKSIQMEANDTTIDQVLSGLSKGEKELYQFMLDRNADISDDVEHSARSNYGVDFQKVANYFPRITRKFRKDFKSKQQETIDELDSFAGLPNKLSTKPGDRLKKRNELADDNFYYDMHAYDVFVTSHYENVLTSIGGRELKAIAYLINSPQFKAFLSGYNNKLFTGSESNFDKNAELFTQKIISVINDEQRSPFYYRNTGDAVEKSVKYLIDTSVQTFLSTADQSVKQYASNYVQTMIVAGPKATGIATSLQMRAVVSPELNAKYDRFLSLFSGQFRSALGLRAYDETKSVFDQPAYIQAPQNFLDFLKDKFSLALRVADKGVNNVGLIAGYIQGLEQQGLKWNGLDDAISNPNVLAITHAENVATKINNASKKSERADVIKNKPEKNEGGVKSIAHDLKYMWTLKGFSLQAYQEFANAIKVMTARKIPEQGSGARTEAARFAASYLTQVVVFNAVKYGLKIGYMAAGGWLAQSLFGIIPSPEDDEEQRKRKQKEFVRFVAQVSGDAFLGGTNAYWENGIKLGANEAFNWYEANLGGKEKAKEEGTIKGTIYDGTFNLYPGVGVLNGNLQIGTEALQTMYDAVASQKQNDKDTEEKIAIKHDLDMVERAKLLAFLIRSGDLLKISNAVDAQLQTKLKEKPRRY